MAGLVLVLVAALAGFVGAGHGLLESHHTGPAASSPSPDHPSGPTRAAHVDALLGRLVVALEGGDRSRALRLAAAGDGPARTQLGAIYHNVHTVGVADLSMRYVKQDSSSASAGPRRYGKGYVVVVQLGWRVAGFDAHDSRQQVILALQDRAGRAWFRSARASHGTPAPLWMLARLRVARSADALAMVAADQSPTRFLGLARRAVTDVRKVLPRWRGRLVVEVPATQRQLDRIFGAKPTQYREIAAVTTTVDGSDRRAAPVHVFVNPKVFDRLGRIGSQIVLSHEATHVAMHAATSQMPTWLLEGFADFVALDHVDLPVTTTAAQILARVRRRGPPAELPGVAQFNTRNPALGAQYEAAWLACRLLGSTYGEHKLIAFYRQADRDSSTETAFPEVLGTTQRAFTGAWRDYLRHLAGRAAVAG